MARAKFVVTVVTPNNNVRLMPQLTGSVENEKFFNHGQPVRGIVLENLSEETIKEFQEGQSYFIDFTPAVVKPAA